MAHKHSWQIARTDKQTVTTGGTTTAVVWVLWACECGEFKRTSPNTDKEAELGPL